MERHEFRMDTRGVDRHNVSRRVKVLLGISLFLTGFGALGGTMSIVSRIREEAWEEMGAVAFCWNVLFALILIISLVGLIRIALDLGEGKVFSRTLTICVWLIGAVITAASMGIPRLPDYQSSGFEILSHGNFVLIDGAILIPGILLVILGSLIQEGFKLQKDEEEIL